MIHQLLAVMHRAEHPHRRAFALALLVSMGGALTHATAMSREVVVASVQHTAAPLVQVITPPAEPELQPVVVWDGIDVDGDGAEDFVNPTGGEPRGHDAFGSGAYGASRDGGGRRHEGVDYVAEAGQEVVAPISGYVTKIGYAYGDDTQYKFVEITNPALHYTARAFYVSPTVREGQAVQMGDAIGTVKSLQTRYSGITDHVHLEIMKSGRRIDATSVITARTEWEPVRG